MTSHKLRKTMAAAAARVATWPHWKRSPDVEARRVKEQKQQVLDKVSDLVSAFLYYDRKEDEDMPRGRIDELVASGVITTEEIVDCFRAELIENLR